MIYWFSCKNLILSSLYNIVDSNYILSAIRSKSDLTNSINVQVNGVHRIRIGMKIYTEAKKG